MARTKVARRAVLGGVVLACVAATVPAGASPPGPDYVPTAAIALGSPVHLVVADLDADGHDDLITTTGTKNAPHIRVALADGPSGSFEPFGDIAFTSDIAPATPAVGDLDGDGDLDIITPAGTLGYAYVLGDGAGAFGPVQTGSASGTTFRVAIGDFIGSSKPDLATGSGSTVTILEGDGTGAFATTGVTLSPNGSLRQLVAADFDGDGLDDLATSAWSGSPTDANMPSTISAFRRTGSGTFAEGDRHEVINFVGSIGAADIDEDHHLDLVVSAAKSSSSGAYILLGAGDGTFEAPSLARLADTPDAVAVGDIDADGHLDLVGDSEGLFVAWGAGDGTFSPSIGYRAGFDVSDPAVSDADGDGDADLLAIGTASPPTPAGVTIVHNDGGRALRGVAMQTWGNTEAVAAGDVTGDGRPDYVQALVRSGYQFEVMRNDGAGRLNPYTSGSLPSTPKGVALARMDGDAKADVVAQTTAGVSIALSKGDGTFEDAVSVAAGTLPSAPPVPLVGDLDGDGSLDVVVVSADATVQTLLGAGDGTVGAATSHPTGEVLKRTALADLDGDGALDLIGTSATTATLRTYLGDGDGGFAATASVTTLPAAATYLAVDDIDGDGRPDAVATSGTTAATAKATVLLGDGSGALIDDGSVSLPNTGYFGAAARGIDRGDVNEDTHADFALDGVRTLLGDCAGQVHVDAGDPFQYDAPSHPVLTDMDGDGHLDRIGHSINGYALVRFGTAPAPAPAAPATPFRSCRTLVDQQYLDLLGRAPTATERTTSARAIADGTSSGGAVVQSLRRSEDHVENVDPVARLYRAYFLRNPDPGGLDYWVKRRRSGTWTLIKISNQFARSSEFTNRYGKLTNTAFVDLVYQNVLGRPGDAQGRAFWINRLESKRATRGQVMLNFSESNEYVTKQASEVDAAVLLTWMLRTTPNGPAFDAAVADLDAGGSVADLATEILNSASYRDRVTGS